MRRTPPYDLLAEFTPIGLVGRYTHFVLVHPKVPATSMAELLTHVRANPNKLNYATGNTTVHVNRVLQKLRRNKLITLKGSTLAVLDWEQLKRVADFDPVYLHLNRE